MNTLVSSLSSHPLSQYPDVADLLVKQGRIRFRISSGSMAPYLQVGDVVDLEAASWEKLRTGDILAVRSAHKIICHQFVRSFEKDGNRWVITKGKQCLYEDSPYLFTHVIGLVIQIKSPRLYHQICWQFQKLSNLFRPRPFWRLWVARQVQRFVRIVEYFVLAFLRPEDLIENNRQYYDFPMLVQSYSELEILRLNSVENYVLEHFAEPRKGKVLILGCGGGREAYTMAQQGWEVFGIDQVASMIQEGEKRNKEDLNIKWFCRDFTKGIGLEGTQVDFICMWDNLYNLIPTRKLRIKILEDCRVHLKPDGICSMTFACSRPHSLLKRVAYILQKMLAWILGGNPDGEIGDLLKRGLFTHHFSSVEEVIEEANLAGLNLIWADTVGAQKMLILKPSAGLEPTNNVRREKIYEHARV